MLQASYAKIKVRYGGKFYAPIVLFAGKLVYLKSAKKTAREALDWAIRFSKKWNELHGKEKISSN